MFEIQISFFSNTDISFFKIELLIFHLEIYVS